MKPVDWPCAAPGGNGVEFALIAGPDKATARVLIVPALLEEANRTRRMLVETMRALADAGVGSLLPDLPGCNESLAPLECQTLGDWRGAMASASAHFSATHVLTLRGGALLSPDLPGWQFEPIGGAQALRPMLRARTVAAREEGRAETMDGLLAEARDLGIELAGYRLGAAMVRDLEAAKAVGCSGQTMLGLDDLGGAALWLRSEPGEDAELSATLAARIVADATR